MMQSEYRASLPRPDSDGIPSIAVLKEFLTTKIAPLGGFPSRVRQRYHGVGGTLNRPPVQSRVFQSGEPDPCPDPQYQGNTQFRHPPERLNA
jgi:hypothetical protein